MKVLFEKIDFFQTIGKELELIFCNGKNNSLSGPVHDIASSRSPEERLEITFTHIISPHGCAQNSGQLFSEFGKMDIFQTIGKELELIFFNGKENSLSGPVHDIASSRSPEGRLEIAFTHLISPHGCARNSGQLFSVF
jgi:hypothetical protein